VSCDFAFFNPDAAPRDGAAFRAWYEEQMDWDVNESDPEPSILAPALLGWYLAMTSRFPDMARASVDASACVDYSFTPDFIYCTMPTTAAVDHFEKLAKQKAQEFKVGIYDPMSDDGRDNRCIVFPDGPLPNPPSFFSKLFGKAKD